MKLFGDSTNPVKELDLIFRDRDIAFLWADSKLKKAEIDPVKKPVLAVRELRRLEPALGLKTAVYLVQKAGLQ